LEENPFYIIMKKAIDCFTFYNELDILELRLKELYSVVDKFILVEAEKTHKGEDKRFIFEDNKQRFAGWLDKIIHVKVYYPSNINDPWGREKFQRNSFMPTLYSLGLSNNDVVEMIANKLENFAHQEYNKDEFKNIDHIEKSILEGRDLFGEWRKFEKIDPEKNTSLPINWRILHKNINPENN